MDKFTLSRSALCGESAAGQSTAMQLAGCQTRISARSRSAASPSIQKSRALLCLASAAWTAKPYELSCLAPFWRSLSDFQSGRPRSSLDRPIRGLARSGCRPSSTGFSPRKCGVSSGGMDWALCLGTGHACPANHLQILATGNSCHCSVPGSACNHVQSKFTLPVRNKASPRPKFDHATFPTAKPIPPASATSWAPWASKALGL